MGRLKKFVGAFWFVIVNLLGWWVSWFRVLRLVLTSDIVVFKSVVDVNVRLSVR